MSGSFKEAKARSQKHCGVGLGLRWDFLDELLSAAPTGQPELPPEHTVAFWEVSPENYMRRGGYFPQALEALAAHSSFLTHGLTMSVGAEDAPEARYFEELQAERARVASPFHSDHLCLSTAGPQVLHDLLPLPLTRKMAQKVADRIRSIEDTLQCAFAIENISYYAHPVPPEMSEADFLCEILRLSGAGLLLDVNNVYVNAQNHGFDASTFIAALPHEQIVQMHIAGHKRLEAPHPAAGLLLDNHGAPVIDPVRDLFAESLKLTGPVPVTLERDNEIPELSELLLEVQSLQKLYEETLFLEGQDARSGHASEARPRE